MLQIEKKLKAMVPKCMQFVAKKAIKHVYWCVLAAFSMDCNREGEVLHFQSLPHQEILQG